MNQNLMQLLRQFNEFKQSIRGKDPQKLLNDMLKSGRFSQDDVNKAKQMAQEFKSILG